MMVLCGISFMEASVRSLLVVIDSCSLVRATPGEGLDQGIPGRTMVARGVALPPVGVILDVDSGWRDPEAERCASSSSAMDSRRRGAAGTRCLTWLDGLAQGGGVVWCHDGTDGRNKRFMRILTLKIARRFDGGDGFCSVCMRYLLRVYYTG
jgi:hypothetical protein